MMGHDNYSELLPDLLNRPLDLLVVTGSGAEQALSNNLFYR
jgi:hypothetical protein